jgi:hypothetical protein
MVEQPETQVVRARISLRPPRGPSRPQNQDRRAAHRRRRTDPRYVERCQQPRQLAPFFGLLDAAKGRAHSPAGGFRAVCVALIQREAARPGRGRALRNPTTGKGPAASATSISDSGASASLVALGLLSVPAGVRGSRTAS